MENNSTWPTSPPSPTLSPSKRGFELGWSLLFALGAILVVFASGFAFAVAGIATGAIDPHTKSIPPLINLLGSIVVFAILALYMLAFLPLLARRSLEALGMRGFGAREIGIALFGAIVMTFSVDLCAAGLENLTHHHETEGAIALLSQVNTPQQAAIFIFLAVALAPIAEELTFRMFLFNAFRRYAPTTIAAILSGIVFGAAHVSAPTSWQFVLVGIPLALGGIILATVYAWSRCYWSNVTTHALFNAFPLVLYFGFHIKS